MATIQLTKGYVALIDDEDADLAQNSYWANVTYETKTYAKRYIRGSKPYRSVHLHREIAERVHGGPLPKGLDVDHINGDPLDNRRANLRVISHRQNMWNRRAANKNSKSGVSGVRQKGNRWLAYICEGMKMKSLGRFDTIEEATAARLAAEAERWKAAA